MSKPLNEDFWQGILLKISFKPEKIKRTQAAPSEITTEQPQLTTA